MLRVETPDDVRVSDELEDAIQEAVSIHPQADRSWTRAQSSKLDRLFQNERDEDASYHLQTPVEGLVNGGDGKLTTNYRRGHGNEHVDARRIRYKRRE